MKESETAGIVLAAGHGKRMESITENKVTLELGGKPMILRTVGLLREVKVNPIVIVVGFQKESVMNIFQESSDIVFAEQRERKGTANAVETALQGIPGTVKDVIILQGDDSAFYTKEIIQPLIEKHRENKSSLTFLTIDVENSFGLGRIVRDEDGNLEGIVEEKDATEKQREIKEINPACYVATVEFLKIYLKEVEPSPVTGEYYLTSLIDLGLSRKEKILSHRAGKIPWRGVNTKDELKDAIKLFSKITRKS